MNLIAISLVTILFCLVFCQNVTDWAVIEAQLITLAQVTDNETKVSTEVEEVTMASTELKYDIETNVTTDSMNITSPLNDTEQGNGQIDNVNTTTNNGSNVTSDGSPPPTDPRLPDRRGTNFFLVLAFILVVFVVTIVGVFPMYDVFKSSDSHDYAAEAKNAEPPSEDSEASVQTLSDLPDNELEPKVMFRQPTVRSVIPRD